MKEIKQKHASAVKADKVIIAVSPEVKRQLVELQKTYRFRSLNATITWLLDVWSR